LRVGGVREDGIEGGTVQGRSTGCSLAGHGEGVVVMSRLSIVLKIQAVVSAIYGLAFIFAPGFTMDTVFGWANQPALWIRAVGAAFVGLAWASWLVAIKVESRLDLVWPFVLVSAVLVADFIWERTVETYTGTDLFYWVSLALAAVLFLAVGGFRLAVGSTKT
jgi:hypothetical protein